MAAKKVKNTKPAKKKEVKKKIELADVLSELQARFDAIVGKLDDLLSKSSAILRMTNTERDPGFKTHATVTKKPYVPHDKDPRERIMHKAVCAECKKDCEVPFVPRAGRPVYCKECYSGRRNGRGPVNIPNRDQIVAEIEKTLKIDMGAPAKAKKAKPKKSAAKKPKAKKARSKK